MYIYGNIFMFDKFWNMTQEGARFLYAVKGTVSIIKHNSKLVMPDSQQYH